MDRTDYRGLFPSPPPMISSGSLKLDHSESIYTVEIGKCSIQVSFSHSPNRASCHGYHPGSSFSDFTRLSTLLLRKPHGPTWLTDLGSVGVQHLHVLQLLQTLTVAEDGRLVIASDKCLIPFSFEGYENKSYRWALYTLQNAFRLYSPNFWLHSEGHSLYPSVGTCHSCLSQIVQDWVL